MEKMMKSCVTDGKIIKFYNGRKALNLFGVLLVGAWLSSSMFISDVRAEDKMDHSMHDMQGMDMSHMDHSMHQQQLSQRGTYTASTVSFTVPDIKLVDVNGKTVVLKELLNDDSAIMLNFIFTTCTTICPVLSATFQQIQEKLGADQKTVRLVSISIDPENDTPAKLKVYAEKFKAGPQWKLLTGSLENSLIAQKAFGVFAGEKMNHKPLIFLKSKNSGNQWVRIEGLAEAGQVIQEYEKISAEKSSH
jgi:protein SCO1/2